MQNLYHILGVVSTATQEEIRAAYIKLTKKYHPDFNPGNLYSEERMKDINRAYDILSDEVARHTYDLQLQHKILVTKAVYYETNTEDVPSKATTQVSEAYRKYEKRVKIFARVVLFIILSLTLGGIIRAIYLNNIAEDEPPKSSYTISQFAGINPETHDTIWRKVEFYGNYSDHQLHEMMKGQLQSDKQTYFWPVDMMDTADLEKWLINNLSGSINMKDIAANDRVYRFSNFRISFSGDTVNISYLINETITDTVQIPMHAFQSFAKNGEGYCIFLSYNTICQYDVKKQMKQWSDRFCFNAVTNNMPGYEKKMNAVMKALSRSK